MDPVRIFEDALRASGKSPCTIRRRAGTLRRFLEHIHPTLVDDASTEDVEAFLRQFASPATRRAYLSDLRAFYRWGIRRRLLRDDPTAVLDPIRVPPPLPRPLEPQELARAYLAADDRLRLILLLGALAGLRRAEIAALVAEDIGDKVIRVRKGKGGKPRQVPIHPVLRAELDAWGARYGPVFPHPDDPSRPIGRAWLGRLVARHFDQLGIDGSTHRLRHSAATNLAAVAQDPWAVAAFLGHANLTTSMVYVQTSGAQLGRHVDAMPDPRRVGAA